MRLTVKHSLVILLLALLASAGFYQFHASLEANRELRRPASPLLRAIDNHDYGSPIENEGNGERIWAIRSPVNKTILAQEIVWATQYIMDLPNIVERCLAENEKDTNKGSRIAKSPSPHLLAPLLEQDGSGTAFLLAALPKDFNDAIDSSGKPVRWQSPESLISGFTRLRADHFIRDHSPKTPTVQLPAVPKHARLSYYRGLVENFARRYNLNTSLVMAIIHSESDFSPTLVSNKSAMGLMQLLPSTASDEVHRFLYGRRGQIGFDDLRNPEINIRYGTAYLHILLNRYFPNVHNRDVREVCAIASYNLGPNRFLRLYGSTNEQAVERINSMSEDEFYEDLSKRLPVRETRYYVEKVRRMKKHYSSLQ